MMDDSVRRVAAVDLGTNSFLLLVLDGRPDGSERVVLDRADIVRLGEGVDASRRLAPAACDRAVRQLAEYTAACRALGVQAARAVGTSALRDAVGRDSFLQRVRAETGWTIEVISGEREAELTYAAVARRWANTDGAVTLVDIGGGSTEVATGRAGRLERRVSIDIGAVRLTDRAQRLADPYTADDLERLRALARQHLSPLSAGAGWLVGTGGTITTLAAVKHGLADYDAARVDATRLSVDDVKALTQRLATLPLARRREVAGLPPGRADVIVAGSVLLSEVMTRLEAASIQVDSGGLRFALAREALTDLA